MACSSMRTETPRMRITRTVLNVCLRIRSWCSCPAPRIKAAQPLDQFAVRPKDEALHRITEKNRGALSYLPLRASFRRADGELLNRNAFRLQIFDEGDVEHPVGVLPAFLLAQRHPDIDHVVVEQTPPETVEAH